MDLGPIWSVKWSVTIDLHWWCCYWRLTLGVVIPLRLKIWKLKALLFPSVWFQSQPTPFNFFWLMANTENSNFFTIVIFSKARIKIRTTMFSRGVLVLLKFYWAPDIVEFVLGRFSHFNIAIAYSNSTFCGAWTPSFCEFTQNFSKTSTPPVQR